MTKDEAIDKALDAYDQRAPWRGTTKAFRDSLKESGYEVVPREATEAMLVSGSRAHDDFYSQPGPYPRTKAVWFAMLAASDGPTLMEMLSQPKIGSRWKHWKDGKIYTVVKFALFCDTDHQERLLVIYEDEAGGNFARSEYEWHNTMPGGVRRFEEIGGPRPTGRRDASWFVSTRRT